MRKSFQSTRQVTELNQAIIGQFHYYLCSIDCSKEWCINASHPLSKKKKHILCNAQYGFRANCSTQQAILDIVNRIQSNLDAGLYSCGVFIDLKKAFDTVDHTILLCKLSHYGIRGIINDWFASYLTDRTRTTLVDASISSKGKILFGVPQGCVKGPLLFLINS